MESIYTAYDYSLMALALFLSFAFGMYQAMFKDQKESTDYLHGAKSMNVFVVSLSIISSGLYGLYLISIPTNVYNFGIGYVLIVFSFIAVGLVSYLWIMPVFFKLGLTSIYQYLELRFDENVKVFCSLLYTSQVFLFLPLLLYVIGSSISHVSNINFYIITPIISIVCIIYTVSGGVRAVIWTNALQYLIMFVCTVIIVSFGIMEAGGFMKAFRTTNTINKLSIEYTVNPTKQQSFWAVIFGTIFQLLGLHVFTQGIVQKYLCVKNYQDIKKTHLLSTIGSIALILLYVMSGVAIIAKYIYCKPISMKSDINHEEILPYFIIEIAKSYPGVSGLFTASMVSVGLCVLSTTLNSLSATMYNDIFKLLLPHKLDSRKEIQALRMVACTVGITCTALVFLYEKFQKLTPLFSSLVNTMGSSITGIFLIGLFLPKINAKGALWGGVASFAVMLWITMGAEWYKMNEIFYKRDIPAYNNSCQGFPSKYLKAFNLNANREAVPYLYRISHYYPIFGIFLVVISTSIISYFTKTNKRTDSRYLSPLLPTLREKFLRTPSDYDPVEQDLTKLDSNDN